MLNFVIPLRWKITGLIGVIVLLITGADAWLVPARAADAERQSLHQRASADAALLANAVAPGLEFAQIDTAQEQLKTGLADPLVRWAAVYDPAGARLAAVERDASPPKRFRPAEATAMTGIIVASAPINAQDEVLGHVAVALKSDPVAERRSQARRAIMMQGALIGAVGLMLALFLSTGILRSVREMTTAAKQIANGDVAAGLKLRHSNDELGQMATAFERMSARLRELQDTASRVAGGDLSSVSLQGEGELFVAFQRMVDGLRDLTNRIIASSDGVSSAAAGMFSAVREQESLATQQTAALEEIRRTLETLTAASQAVAEDATAVREMSEKTLRSSQRMAEQTHLVSGHSERIGEILSLIQDIADRSDLLAFNAALEGTKAGEVGRGFSLVAAEMRRLSEHVMDSVRDIRKLVADTRSASHASVMATEESIKLAQDAAAAAAKISEAASHQREGTAQAKISADEVVHAVNEGLTGVAATTQSAEALLELSHELKQTVREFQIGALATELHVGNGLSKAAE